MSILYTPVQYYIDALGRGKWHANKINQTKYPDVQIII